MGPGFDPLRAYQNSFNPCRYPHYALTCAARSGSVKALWGPHDLLPQVKPLSYLLPAATLARIVDIEANYLMSHGG